MVVSRLTLGTAVLGLVTLMACSDRAGTITAQNGRPSNFAVSDAANADRTLRAGDNQIIWGPAPPIFPPGAQFAVLQGDPSKAGEIFTIRLRFPNGYVLPPHTHPTRGVRDGDSRKFPGGHGRGLLARGAHAVRCGRFHDDACGDGSLRDGARRHRGAGARDRSVRADVHPSPGRPDEA